MDRSLNTDSDLWIEGNKSEHETISGMFIMVYIGFSTKTHKLMGRILCKHFRHCAPIQITKTQIVLYQFVNKNNIVKIPMKLRDINILRHNGWEFIKYSGKFAPGHELKSKSITCVQFTKHVCMINKITIQTPDALFRFLTRQ